MKKSALIIAFLSTINMSLYAGGGSGSVGVGRKSAGCTGTGFCSITHTSTGNLAAVMDFEASSDKLIITIKSNDIAERYPDVEKLMQRNAFIQPESVELTAELCKTLGSNSIIVVPKGTYPIQERNGVYSITIEHVEYLNE